VCVYVCIYNYSLKHDQTFLSSTRTSPETSTSRIYNVVIDALHQCIRHMLVYRMKRSQLFLGSTPTSPAKFTSRNAQLFIFLSIDVFICFVTCLCAEWSALDHFWAQHVHHRRSQSQKCKTIYPMPLPVSLHPCLQDEALSTIFELNTYITGEVNLKNVKLFIFSPIYAFTCFITFLSTGWRALDYFWAQHVHHRRN